MLSPNRIYQSNMYRVGFATASVATKLWHLLFTQGVVLGIGLCFIFNSVMGIVPQWFQKRRSLANSIGAAGTGAGGLVYTLATGAMLRNLSVSWALRILAILSFIVNTGCCLLVRDRNKALGSVLSALHRGLLGTPDFQLLMGWAFCSMFSYVTLVYTVVDFTQYEGYSASQASIAGAMFFCKLRPSPRLNSADPISISRDRETDCRICE